MVVLDESSSFKNSSSKRFKALKLVREKIKRIVEFTETPASNILEDNTAAIEVFGCKDDLSAKNSTNAIKT